MILFKLENRTTVLEESSYRRLVAVNERTNNTIFGVMWSGNVVHSMNKLLIFMMIIPTLF